MTDHRDEHEAYAITPPPAVVRFRSRIAQLLAEAQSNVAMALESLRLSEEEVRRLRRQCDMEAAHVAELKEQVRSIALERDAAREKIARIMAGLEGCCMTCEPVGVRNQQMERDIATLRAERDEARREVLLWMRERCSRSEMTDEIKKRGWDCFENSPLDRLAKLDEECGLQ